MVPDEVDLIAGEVSEQSRAHDVVFTSGGVGPTHDDVTIHGVARAVGARVARDQRLVSLLEAFYRDRLTEARLKMAEVPEGAELIPGEGILFPAIAIRNVYILPGVPEIFRQKFEALRERFRESPFFLASVFVTIPEGTLADHLNELLAGHPELLLGSYPEFANAEYKVKVTLESKDRGLMERAVGDLLSRLPAGSVVRIERSPADARSDRPGEGDAGEWARLAAP